VFSHCVGESKVKEVVTSYVIKLKQKFFFFDLALLLGLNLGELKSPSVINESSDLLLINCEVSEVKFLFYLCKQLQ
jgi:hypothetical protein